MTVVRRVAMSWGPAPTRSWWRSSSKVTARTQCKEFSMPQLSLDPAGDGTGLGPGHGHRGDRVDDLNVPAPVDGSRATGLDDLGRAGPVHPGRDFERLDGAAGAASAPGLDVGVRGDLRPGQRLEVCQQAGLVGLDGQDVVPALAGDPLRGCPLAVQGVGGDHHVGHVDGGEQLAQGGDLAALVRHGLLGPRPHRARGPERPAGAASRQHRRRRAGSCRRWR